MAVGEHRAGRVLTQLRGRNLVRYGNFTNVYLTSVAYFLNRGRIYIPHIFSDLGDFQESDDYSCLWAPYTWNGAKKPRRTEIPSEKIAIHRQKLVNVGITGDSAVLVDLANQFELWERRNFEAHESRLKFPENVALEDLVS